MSKIEGDKKPYQPTKKEMKKAEEMVPDGYKERDKDRETAFLAGKTQGAEEQREKEGIVDAIIEAMKKNPYYYDPPDVGDALEFSIESYKRENGKVFIIYGCRTNWPTKEEEPHEYAQVMIDEEYLIKNGQNSEKAWEVVNNSKPQKYIKKEDLLDGDVE